MSVSEQLMQQDWFNLLYLGVFIVVGVIISIVIQAKKDRND